MSSVEEQEAVEAEEAAAAQPEDDDEAEAEGEPVEAIVGDEADRRAANEAADEEQEAAAAQRKSLEALQRHVTRRLKEIFAVDDLGVVPCPACSPLLFSGYVFPTAPPEEIQVALREWLGMIDPSRYQADNYSRRCDQCAGLGQTRSGSLVLGNELVKCVPCKGLGWISVGAERSGQAVMAQPPGQTVDVNTPVAPSVDRDPWNRLPDHPDYGKLPQFSSQPLPDQG